MEAAVVGLLKVENCGRVLAWSSWSGLERAARKSREHTLREFDEFARTAGFMAVGKEELGSLLDNDRLFAEEKGRVFEAVVRWMKGRGGGEARGSGLLGKVRFPLTNGGHLTELLRNGGGSWQGLRSGRGKRWGCKV